MSHLPAARQRPLRHRVFHGRDGVVHAVEPIPHPKLPRPTTVETPCGLRVYTDTTVLVDDEQPNCLGCIADG